MSYHLGKHSESKFRFLKKIKKFSSCLTFNLYFLFWCQLKCVSLIIEWQITFHQKFVDSDSFQVIQKATYLVLFSFCLEGPQNLKKIGQLEPKCVFVWLQETFSWYYLQWTVFPVTRINWTIFTHSKHMMRMRQGRYKSKNGKYNFYFY